MMERKRALTIPFSRGKDNIMENPLRIPTTYLECGKFQQQIPWTAIAGHKSRRRDSKHTNGAVLFDHNHAAMVRLGLSVRKPCLILTDVLKTEAGKAYMAKIKRHVNGKESGRVKDLPIVSKDRRSKQRKSTNSKNKSVSPKSKQTPDSSYNGSTSRSAKKAQTTKEESDLENNDEVGSGKNGVEPVDCGLSVMREQENHGKSSATENKKTEPKKSQKRKVNDIVSECTETDSPKRPRASVLRLSGALDMEGEATICSEKEAEDKALKSTDGGIMQFTVGEGDKTAEPSNSMSLDNGATTAITEPIVLSSDDEENYEKIVSQKQLSQKALSPQQKPDPVEDMQVFQVLVNDNSDLVKDTCLCLAFSDLYCGPYHAKANGDILITDENIIIPLKKVTEEMDLIITLERKQLRRYSVWNKGELESLKYFSDRNASEIPAAGLLCCVSEDAAEGVQYDLVELCDKPESPRTTGIPSPFIVIFLQDSLEGMEGAFLRSLLDIDCLSSLTRQQTLGEYDQEITGPGLSLDQSVELIKSSGLDVHLLQLLDQGRDITGADYGQESTSNCDLKIPKDTVLKLGKTSDNERPSQVEEAAQPKETPNLPAEKDAIEPVYTLCHRRLEDSYSVTMCKPDSSWVKYKHRGLARRLIQFPPPPMKGGITVTMEDLQCLDIGQYLNDVIIDFYLKYLLQNAPESVARRSHIFSSFFYKQLTRRDNASEGSNSESCQRQKRYQRVRTWTRHVDIFSKDFIFVPVNQEAHWYLVVICFPGLEEPKTETFSQGQDETQSSESPNENAANKHDATDTEKDTTIDPVLGSVACTEQTCRRKTVCKRPCILVMDSLKRSPHERVFKLMREYLQSEWEARRGSSRDFGPDQMESSHCNVPLQDNSSDCGLYLLHYVESFLKDPIVHFDLPLHLKFWFPRHQVRRKREEIRDLVLKLYRTQNMNVKA
ncbi:sentrin-specific protease 7 isoform X2 [Boleophthalmus pectinirostris]|uniref:sentrin-specific protease 7 isoform X2 n=1 Tax=Boleophthalmus pectinirostris TaxID=150288 RepID=UPI00242AB71C|nr:sentrin-specific protease 7 isoform X2 [Boleophthalmus pectinirostris]